MTQILRDLNVAVQSMAVFKSRGNYLCGKLEWMQSIVTPLSENKCVSQGTDKILPPLIESIGNKAKDMMRICKKCQKGRVYRMLLSEDILSQLQSLDTSVQELLNEVSQLSGVSLEPEDLVKAETISSSDSKMELLDLQLHLQTGNGQEDSRSLLKRLIEAELISETEVEEFRKDMQEDIEKFLSKEEKSLSNTFLKVVHSILSDPQCIIFENTSTTPVGVPSEYICPITMDIMRDPVVLVESGNSYERTAICTWISSGKATEPCTGEELNNVSFTPNRSLKKLIYSYMESIGRPFPEYLVPSSNFSDTMSESVAKNFTPRFTFDIDGKFRLIICQGDITKWNINGQNDAIVNAANERMLGGSGVDGAIHNAAGPVLYQLCLEKPEIEPNVRCPTGSAVPTGAANLSVKFVIHTVGPIYFAIDPEVAQSLLRDAYRNSLKVAKDIGVQHVAFPAISCGIYGYPLNEAAEVSLQVVKENSDGLSEVYFVLFSGEILHVWAEAAQAIFGPPVDSC